MATLAAPETGERAPVPAFFAAQGGASANDDASAHLLRESDRAPLHHARSVYSASAGSRPMALVATVAVMVGMGAVLATLNIVAAHRDRARLATVDVRLDVTPPPPPPEPTRLDTPKPVEIQTVAPKPLIQLPSPGPQQVMVDAPPPPMPAVVTTVGVKSAAPPAPAPAPATTTMEGGDLASKVLSAKPPTYPMDARRAHEQGTVKLLVLVGSDGLVRDIQVASSSGSSRLDGAALRAVRHWRWSPTMANGVAMAVRGYVTIPFVLTTPA